MATFNRLAVFSYSFDDGRTWRIIDAETNNPARNEYGDELDGGGFNSDGGFAAHCRATNINRERGILDDGAQARAAEAYRAFVTNAAGAGQNTADNTAHSPDYRSVRWYGAEHSFTTKQAPAVKLLWDAWEQGTPDVGDETLLSAADSEGPLRNLFRDHTAWGTMITAGGSKGSHRLSTPAKLPTHAKYIA